MPLKEYHRKRNFRKTPEPKSTPRKKVSKKSATVLHYFIQEHHATHLHYDFRLEWQGVLKSWAIPKGPSMDPQIKRLAVEVEDHPLDYGRFEGEIPKGQYGAGQVILWDEGVWTPLSDPQKGFKKGHLEFELKGKKLKGRWDLIRTTIPGRQKQWLLIKRKERVSPTPPAKKTPEKKMQFVEPELAQLAEKPPQGNEWIHELKYDGYRIQVHVNGSNVRLLTRTGEDWSEKFPTLLQAFRQLKIKNAIIDGEVVWLDSQGRSSFQLLQNALNNHNTNTLIFYAFDLLFESDKDLREKPLKDRRQHLKKLLNSSGQHIRFSEDFKTSGAELLKVALKHGLEGIISKDSTSPYISGRSSRWLKTKKHHQQEFVIGGYVEGAGARFELGALLLGVYDGKILRFAGKVGTGFTEKSLREILKKLRPLEQSSSPFAANSPRERGIHWVRPTLSADVSFHNWTDDGRLRIPVFHGLREDKPVQEIQREHPKKSSAPWLVSHPDKIIYAKEKISKQEIANYYKRVASSMVPLMQNRPLALFRSPEGTHRSSFFQKHLPNPLPEGLEGVEIQEKSGNKTYVNVLNSKGLESLIQMGSFEIHCWNSHKDHLDFPDQIVMDFDPGPGITWSQVVTAAFDLKKILEKLSLKSFVKLSGGKGLHVHIPIRPIYHWTQIKNFSEVLAKEMENRQPHLYISKMSKAAREKKIFIDFFRNHRGSTAVAPYSLRSRAMSSAALPVEWSQLKEIKSSDEFTLTKTFSFLRQRKKDPWRNFSKIQQKIPLLDRLNKKQTKEQKPLEANH